MEVGWLLVAVVVVFGCAYFYALEEKKTIQKYHKWIMEAVPADPNARTTGHELYRRVRERHEDADSKIFYRVLKKMKKSGAIRYFDSDQHPSGQWAIAVASLA